MFYVLFLFVVMSKRKLRTPIKRSSSNETEEIKSTEELKLPEQSLKLVEKRERKCKKISTLQDDLSEERETADDKLDEENEDDEPKLIGRGIYPVDLFKSLHF